LQEKFPPLWKGGGGGKTGVVENPSSCLSFGLGPQKLDATQLDNLHTEMAALFDGFHDLWESIGEGTCPEMGSNTS